MINDKSKFLKSLSKKEFNNGLIKVLIDDGTGVAESIWAYQDKNSDKSFAILANTPLSYFPVLYWGAEVKLKHHVDMAVVDNEWIVKEQTYTV